MKLRDLAKSAVSESSAELTASLRRSAYYQGWDSECGRSLVVECDGDSFDVGMSQKAEDTEFGWGNSPSPAVRTWANDTQSVEQAIMKAANRRLKGVL